MLLVSGVFPVIGDETVQACADSWNALSMFFWVYRVKQLLPSGKHNVLIFASADSSMIYDFQVFLQFLYILLHATFVLCSADVAGLFLPGMCIHTRRPASRAAKRRPLRSLKDVKLK